MSHCFRAIVAANSAVRAPTPATTALATGASANSTPHRATRYTPAVTIVAAWISADTGVGPCIASGSHVYRGIWADLPVQPRNKNSVMAVISAPPRGEGAGGPMHESARTPPDSTLSSNTVVRLCAEKQK